ncbi:M23 family metallopeptidase [Microbacterium sp. NPDC097977]|uniref:M23 family metallopeptidase n=1 Tax=Microbacterium sp. NPDC097977 TaxID=3155686 RepID=UPI00332034C7
MPTRRSSRTRTTAVEAPAAGVPDVASEAAPVAPQNPSSRRAARERLNTAEVIVAAAAVAAATAAAESAEIVEIPDTDDVLEHAVDAPEAPVPAAEAEASDADGSDESDPSPSLSSSSEEEDAFESAARAFRSVASGSIPMPAAAADRNDDEAEPTVHVARRRPQARKFLAVGATVGVMSLAGLLAVGMTLPAEAVAAVQGSPTLAATSLVAASGAQKAGAADDEIQAFVTSSDVQNESLTRSDSFSTVSLIQVASEEGINYSNEVFTNDPEAAIQWPFKVGVGMSSGYGMRWGRLHEGIDFVPGEGAPIQAVADGVVRIATEQGGAYGVTVYIDHVIDGQIVTSHYSHMQYGSLQVKAGQTVKVGDIVGHTGNTGRSYGAHLHFEIIINGSTIDPLPWLRENAGRYSY